MRRALLSLCVLSVIPALSACGGGGSPSNSSAGAAVSAAAACAAAEGVAEAAGPGVVLAYPPSGSANVSPSIGEVIVSEEASSETLTVANSSGTIVASQIPAPAPSPLPTPLPPLPLNSSYFFITLPTLASATKYNVSYTETVNASTANPCRFTVAVGSFST